MGRKKKSKLSINNRTIFNIFGFITAVGGIICLISFFHLVSPDGTQGRMLQTINQTLLEKFGGLSVLVPLLIILFSGHFFNTKKVKFVKLNLSIGLILLFISLLGFFQAGEYGKMIFNNLTMDFSVVGMVIILVVCFIIGVILTLDTSVESFIAFIVNGLKSIGTVFKDHVFAAKDKGNKRKLNEKKQPEEEEFIMDNTSKKEKEKIKPMIPNIQPMTASPAANAAAHNAVQAPNGSANNGNFMVKSMSNPVTSTWIYPPLNLLMDVNQKEADRGDVTRNADIIEKTLDSFGIRARVAEVNKGPTVTQYALAITMGTKLSKITALGNDLALALAAPTGQVRIEAPIPGRSLVGVEIPNQRAEIVTLKRLLSSEVFTQNADPLLVPLGLDVSGEASAATIAKMPHVLIAGTTGSGKSVALNSWICTILFRAKPDEVRMILVDPKRVELAGYNGIPHLLTDVIVEPDKILSALKWTVGEMEARYKEFAKVGVRNLEGFNAIEGGEKKPYIIFVIDELADLMMFAPGDAEDLITRIAQMARATGIHLILATQRPSVDVITGLMKANIPSRLAFSVSSMIDSRVILDSPGAEKLLGKGDMLYLPPDQAKPRRIQGPFVTEKEVNDLVKFLKSQTPEVHYTEEITESTGPVMAGGVPIGGGAGSDNDPLFNQAVEIIAQFDKASASLLQRRLKVGYARAARMLDELEAAGYVGPAEGSKPREVIKRSQGDMSVG
jgi:S-DNA-T family DNA segregation ATPase FtsK/SpoIIIE